MKDTVDDERLMAWAAIEPMTSSRKIGRPQPKEPPIFTPPNSPSLGTPRARRSVPHSAANDRNPAMGSSDGGKSDWARGIALYERATGRQAPGFDAIVGAGERPPSPLGWD